jgi:hypothetical protein
VKDEPIYLICANALATVSDCDPLDCAGPASLKLSDRERALLLSRTTLRFARYHNFGTVLGEIATNLLRPFFRGYKRGVIANGGATHLETSWASSAKLCQTGADFLNPIMFPTTLSSALATTVAASTESHALALAVGTTGHAFFQMMGLTDLLLRSGMANEMLVVSTFDPGTVYDRSLAHRNEQICKSVGLAYLATFVKPPIDHIEFSICSRNDLLSSRPDVTMVKVDAEDYTLGPSLGSALLAEQARDRDMKKIILDYSIKLETRPTLPNTVHVFDLHRGGSHRSSLL